MFWTNLVLQRMLVATVLCVTFVGMARAADDATCRRYATNAALQYADGNSNRCGFPNGPRWQPNTANHYNWCRSAPAGWPESEEAIRNAYVRLCKHDQVAINCQDYVRQSGIQIAKAKSANCQTDSTPRWTAAPDSHFAWCVSTNGSLAPTEIATRNHVIANCLSGTTGGTTPPGMGGTTPPGGQQQPFCAASCDECAAANMRCRSASADVCPTTSFEQRARTNQCY